jgi:2'-5' RNA ligase
MISDKQFNRLFFALWPNDQIRQSITEVSSLVSIPDNARITPFENLHITLHFIGKVAQEAKDCLHHAAQSVDQKPFLVSLDCFGNFDRAKIFWMGCQHLPVELVQLYRDLGESLADCGYHIDPRQYAPHVSLMRKCMNPPNTNKGFLIPWLVDEFVLVESVSAPDGVHYQVIEKYPLA